MEAESGLKPSWIEAQRSHLDSWPREMNMLDNLGRILMVEDDPKDVEAHPDRVGGLQPHQ